MVYMLLGTGFEETEAIAPLDLLRRAGVEILTVGINGKTVSGSHKIKVEADITMSCTKAVKHLGLLTGIKEIVLTARLQVHAENQSELFLFIGFAQID